MQRLPEQLLPELRAKWIKLSGAREAVQPALAHVQGMEADYQNTLNTCMRMLGIDPGLNYRVDLETGAIEVVTAENGQAAPVPPVVPSGQSAGE